jgi:hypothetical protein
MIVTVWLQNKTTRSSVMKVTANVFGSVLMNVIQFSHKSCAHMNSHGNVWSSVLCKKVQFAYQRPIVPVSVEERGVVMWLEYLTCWCPLLCDLIADETHVFKNLINQARLRHRYGDRTIRIKRVSDVNTKKILDVTLVFEQEFGQKTFAQIIDGGVVIGEKEAIIRVKDNYAIFLNEQTGINLGLNKTTAEETFLQMQVPIARSLFYSIKIAFKPDKVFSINGPWIISVLCQQPLRNRIIEPTLWNTHKNIVITQSL